MAANRHSPRSKRHRQTRRCLQPSGGVPARPPGGRGSPASCSRCVPWAKPFSESDRDDSAARRHGSRRASQPARAAPEHYPSWRFSSEQIGSAFLDIAGVDGMRQTIPACGAGRVGAISQRHARGARRRNLACLARFESANSCLVDAAGWRQLSRICGPSGEPAPPPLPPRFR